MTLATNVVEQKTFGLTAAIGTSRRYAKEDHCHGTPDSDIPVGGTPPSSTVVSETTWGKVATAGTADTYARGDHCHGTPANPAPSPSSSVSTSATSSAGVSLTYSRGDHSHGSSVGATILDELLDVTISSPASKQVLQYDGVKFVNSAITADEVSLGKTYLGNLLGLTTQLQVNDFVNQLLGVNDLPHGLVMFADETERDAYFAANPDFLTTNMLIVLLGTARALKFNNNANSQYLLVI